MTSKIATASMVANASPVQVPMHLSDKTVVKESLSDIYVDKPSSPSSSTSTSSREGSPVEEELSEQAALFFKSVSPQGFPNTKSDLKAQPWRKLRIEPELSPDGRVIVACPKICVYGSNNLGGL